MRTNQPSAAAEPMSPREVSDLIEAVRLSFGPARFTPTSARVLSRLAQLDPETFRTAASSAATCPESWVPAWGSSLKGAETERMDEAAFTEHMARLAAVFTTVMRLESSRPGPAMAVSLIVRSAPSTPRRCAAVAFAEWATGTALKDERGVPEQDLSFIEEHLEDLIQRAPAARERGSVDRVFLEALLNVDAASLSEGVL